MSGAGTITAYGTNEAGVPVKGADGKLQGRCIVKVPKEDGIPDGMTIDRCEQSISRQLGATICGLVRFLEGCLGSPGVDDVC